MTFQEPKKWAVWLPLAEWWYNTSYHTSLKSTAFEALYGYPPPQISEIMVAGPDSPAIDFIQQKQQMVAKFKENVAQAQNKMNKFIDKNRYERKFILGDMVYLKLQPYGHTSLSIHNNLTLSTIYFGPFRIIECIGGAAYKLQLPANTDIHPVFHVSQLKKHLGSKAIPQAKSANGYIRWLYQVQTTDYLGYKSSTQTRQHYHTMADTMRES
jgi:hypothetical protein